MSLPFTAEQFLDVFARYHADLALAPWLLGLLALACVALASRPGGGSGRLVAVGLAALWVWMGAVYHLGYFAAVNPAARGFGAAFLLEAALLLASGLGRTPPRFRLGSGPAGVAGALIMAWVLIGYPLTGLALGHRFPRAPSFGHPCPGTLFTLGMMMLATPRPPLHLMVVPWIWTLIGTSAALTLGMWQDVSLAIAGLASATGWAAAGRRAEVRAHG